MRKPKLDPKRQALLAEYAHAMRQVPTESEAALWHLLSGRKLGAAFRRQVPLAGRFIADFLAPSARLVVEVDGGCHRGRAQRDARRDRVLARLGYRVLRLEASLVLREPELARARILAALSCR
jgi:very-short-patch-repair endonuclease